MLDWGPSWLWVMFGIYILVPIIVYLAIPFIFYHNKSHRKKITLYVLGDIGHSPRMCYHAKSFSLKGFDVHLCGYMDEQPSKDILNDSNITIYKLPEWKNKDGELFIVNSIKKVLYQTIKIVEHLWVLRGSDYILIQNPPSIPILPIVVIFKIIFRNKLIIDWHNFGYSVLQLKLKSFWHPLVLISYLIEYGFGKFADYNLTVTSAMKQYLIKSFGISPRRIVVLYDRPGKKFQPLSIDRLNALNQSPIVKYIPDIFDIKKGDRILVTSTSFTPDEDISILIGALKIYENSFEKFDQHLPRILLFITGKGPLKQKYVEEVNRFSWNRCYIKFIWLKAEDYPKMLQVCDYGVSLHNSSSGLDLPMKILDMFGSGLPVIAMNYPVLDELVTHGVNGLKFIDRRELHESLIFIMKDKKTHEDLKRGVLEESDNRWDQNWYKAMTELKILH